MTKNEIKIKELIEKIVPRFGNEIDIKIAENYEKYRRIKKCKKTDERIAEIELLEEHILYLIDKR